jgi:hypothetical protein
MQHERDKNWVERVERESDDRPQYDPQSAVELLEIALIDSTPRPHRKRDEELKTIPDPDEPLTFTFPRYVWRHIIHTVKKGDPDEPLTVTLPRYVWQYIVDAAKKGLHKGGGRKRPKDTRGDTIRKNAIVSWARKFKDDLIATGKSSAQAAKEQAAEEAAKLGRERYGFNLSPSTIRTRMGRSPK